MNNWLSQKAVDYILSPKRGAFNLINPYICSTITAKGQNNWRGCSPTLRANKVCVGVMMEEIYEKALNQTPKDSKIRIRKLTPRECWRLMAFDDADFDKAQKVNSNTQLYKQAGNSIVVSVLEAIFKEML